MSLYTILVIILILFLIGALPEVSNHSFGYYPSGGLGLIVLILIILLILGRL